MARLPWMCPDHPGAQIRRERTFEQYHMNMGMTSTEPLCIGRRYFCAECGTELAPGDGPLPDADEREETDDE